MELEESLAQRVMDLTLASRGLQDLAPLVTQHLQDLEELCEREAAPARPMWPLRPIRPLLMPASRRQGRWDESGGEDEDDSDSMEEVSQPRVALVSCLFSVGVLVGVVFLVGVLVGVVFVLGGGLGVLVGVVFVGGGLVCW